MLGILLILIGGIFYFVIGFGLAMKNTKTTTEEPGAGAGWLRLFWLLLWPIGGIAFGLYWLASKFWQLFLKKGA